MKAIYDISVLGACKQEERSRTGVFRAVEGLAHGLAASDQCEVRFAGPQFFEYTMEYLLADPALRGVPFSHAKYRTDVLSVIADLGRRIEGMPHGSKRVLMWKLRGLVRRVDRLLNLVVNSSNIAKLEEVDVYHSPFWDIPDQVRRATHLQRFLTIYDLTPIRFPHWFAYSEEAVMKKTLAGIGPEDWTICCSESTKSDLCNHAEIDPTRVFVTPLSADADRFYPCTNPEHMRWVRKKYDVPDAPYILSLCTLQPRKNLEHLIRCFGRLVQQEKLADLRLVLAGPKGWKDGPIFDAIQELGSLKRRVIVTGFVADEDLAPLYSGAMMFACPSLYEGFGLPPLEAMQCGIPVISSNSSSLPEVVGDAGMLAEPTDVEGWCQKMLEVYQNGELRAAMSAKSLEQATRFSWVNCTSLTVRAYQTAISVSVPEPSPAEEAVSRGGAFRPQRR